MQTLAKTNDLQLLQHIVSHKFSMYLVIIIIITFGTQNFQLHVKSEKISMFWRFSLEHI